MTRNIATPRENLSHRTGGLGMLEAPGGKLPLFTSCLEGMFSAVRQNWSAGRSSAGASMAGILEVRAAMIRLFSRLASSRDLTRSCSSAIKRSVRSSGWRGHSRVRTFLPLTPRRVFLSAFRRIAPQQRKTASASALRERQTRREAGAQSHGPPGWEVAGLPKGGTHVPTRAHRGPN